MDKFIFILGNNPELSVAEIKTVFSNLKPLAQGRSFFIAQGELDAEAAMKRLGGTIKIGRLIGEKIDEEKIINKILAVKNEGKKKFGFSFYEIEPDRKIGMRLKNILKEQGVNSRLVVSREKTLSSVIVRKEKCLDFLAGPGFFGRTLAVQDFEEYGLRDYGRPRSDSYSGMLPPKLAKMMVNLSGAGFNDKILDPFCGSGTVLSEAAVLGFGDLAGCDVSDKAVRDTKENLDWLLKNNKSETLNSKQIQNQKSKIQSNIFQCDARNLSQRIKAASVSAIVTEPYLGPALKGRETAAEILKIKKELTPLYRAALGEFKKVLKTGGKIVMVLPEWHLPEKTFALDVDDKLKQLGFKRLDQGGLVYKRERQKVWRRIAVIGN